MSTGDVQGNLERLRAQLRSVGYPHPVDVHGLKLGIPAAFLPLLHFSLLGYSRHVARYLSISGYELYAKSDLRFMECMLKFLRAEFSYRCPLTLAQFFSKGFSERKMIFVHDVIQVCKRKHNELLKMSRKVSSRKSELPSVKKVDFPSSPTSPSSSLRRLELPCPRRTEFPASPKTVELPSALGTVLLSPETSSPSSPRRVDLPSPRRTDFPSSPRRTDSPPLPKKDVSSPAQSPRRVEPKRIDISIYSAPSPRRVELPSPRRTDFPSPVLPPSTSPRMLPSPRLDPQPASSRVDLPSPRRDVLTPSPRREILSSPTKADSHSPRKLDPSRPEDQKRRPKSDSELPEDLLSCYDNIRQKMTEIVEKLETRFSSLEQMVTKATKKLESKLNALENRVHLVERVLPSQASQSGEGNLCRRQFCEKHSPKFDRSSGRYNERYHSPGHVIRDISNIHQNGSCYNQAHFQDSISTQDLIANVKARCNRTKELLNGSRHACPWMH